MEKVIKLIGEREDIERALAELKSNIDYDNLDVKVQEEKDKDNADIRRIGKKGYGLVLKGGFRIPRKI